MGRQILQGNLNLVNSSFPVPMFEPRSYLQKMADVWAYPDLINASAQQQEPLERMKLLVAWLVAGIWQYDASVQLTPCSSDGNALLAFRDSLCDACTGWEAAYASCLSAC